MSTFSTAAEPRSTCESSCMSICRHTRNVWPQIHSGVKIQYTESLKVSKVYSVPRIIFFFALHGAGIHTCFSFTGWVDTDDLFVH